MNPLTLPHLTDYINDFSSVLTTDQKQSLDTLFRDHETQTTEQVVTVFIPHREWHELLDIGLKVFNENGIGQKNLNNGLLLIVATEEKKLRIIVGKWLELKYTEMACRDIVENHLRPLLNEGKYEEMIKRFSDIVDNKAISQETDTKKPIFFPDPDKEIIFEIPKNSRAEWYVLLWSIGIIILLVIFFIRWCSQVDWSIGNSSSSNSSSSDWWNSSSSDWSSSDSSSSFDGWGWSSNGGGYGD